MTNKQAIKLLKKIQVILRGCENTPTYLLSIEALDLAIKALQVTEQVNTAHNGVQMFPKGTFKSIYDNESLISTKVVTDYIKSHIHEIISESGRDLNEHTNQVLRSIIKDVEEYQESEG